ncbi:MAG: hypothetical protein ACOYOP_16705 [Microthrixaceae bacterium]
MALVITVTSIGILTIALGLLTTVKADGRSNRQQRLNLAVTSFNEAVKRGDWIVPTCPAVSSPPATSADADLGADPSHAALILSQALADPVVDEWVSRGVVFAVTGVQYWGADGQGTPIQSGDGFTGSCSDPAYSWPVIRVETKACFRNGGGACDPDGPVLTATTSKRGFRLNTPGNP